MHPEHVVTLARDLNVTEQDVVDMKRVPVALLQARSPRCYRHHQVWLGGVKSQLSLQVLA